MPRYGESYEGSIDVPEPGNNAAVVLGEERG